MTVGNCADACAEGSYTLAGVEYGGEVSFYFQFPGISTILHMYRVRNANFQSAGVVTLSTLIQHLPSMRKNTAISHVMET